MLRILDALPAEIAIVNCDGTISATNRAWDRVAAKGGLRQPGGSWNYLDECSAAADRGCAEAGEIAQGIRRVLSGELEQFVKVYPCAFDGLHHWFQLSVSPVTAEIGGGAVIMHADVTALQHDPLTKLANRALLEAQLDLALSEAGRAGLIAALLLIDLDKFKPVNDQLGHLAGDRLLVEVAGRLRACVRAGDLAARLGGDEFVVVLGPTVRAEQAQAITARIITALNEPYRLDGGWVMVGASAGLAFWPTDGRTGEELMASADRALYAAKAAGGCRCEPATTIGSSRRRAPRSPDHVAA
jgi:diguanylate cyclase (GGDEF)-like protein